MKVIINYKNSTISMLSILLLEEANAEDIAITRRQAHLIRILPILLRGDFYVLNYRLSEELIVKLEEDIRPLLSAARRRTALNVRTKFLAVLSFLANGSYQRQIGQNANSYMSQPSVSRCLHEIVNALSHQTIVNKYLKFPQTAEERQILKEKFYGKYRIPGVIGCVDGTFVTMIRPSEYEERFFCRKGNHARNVMLISNADQDIIHVDPSYGGATHDSLIFSVSEIKTHLEALTNAGENVCLLGDSGYSQRAYMMIPVGDAVAGSPEDHYNDMHKPARSSVERVIGKLKGRFRCLLVHRVLHYNPDMVSKIVIACSVLHNICNRAGLPVPELDEADIQREFTFRNANRQQGRRETSGRDLAFGRLRRNQLINQLWRARHN